jgi:hypothetical protein
MDHDAPAGSLVQAIDFERHRGLSHGGIQFGAHGRAKDDSPVVKAIVDGENLGLPGVNEANSTHLVIPEESKAFGMTEDFHPGVVCGPIGHIQLLEECASSSTLTNQRVDDAPWLGSGRCPKPQGPRPLAG